MHDNKAIAIPITGSENSDQLTQLVEAALVTVIESEMLTQGQIMTVDPNASCATNTASYKQLLQ